MTIEPVVDAEIVRSTDEWAAVIKADLNRVVDGIVSAGRNLIAAKADVRHGEWLPMLAQIGIDRTEAHRLMKIGETFGNVGNCQHLPTAMRALYELSRLEPEQIEDGIADGVITPDMTISAAKDFARPTPAPVPEPCTALGQQGAASAPKRRRGPLPDDARRLSGDMMRLTNRINKLLDDDRFNANAEAIGNAIRPYAEWLEVAAGRLHQATTPKTGPAGGAPS